CTARSDPEYSLEVRPVASGAGAPDTVFCDGCGAVEVGFLSWLCGALCSSPDPSRGWFIPCADAGSTAVTRAATDATIKACLIATSINLDESAGMHATLRVCVSSPLKRGMCFSPIPS